MAFIIGREIELYADDLRGDTIDLHSYVIRLDMSRVATDSLWSQASVLIKAKIDGVNSIRLDLLSLIVDSVLVNGNTQAFTYDDSLLSIGLPATLNNGDSDLLDIYYHGHPVETGFGGFYWTPPFYFNMGEGAPPYVNTGKCWFPCFDNFDVRSNFEYYVSTLAPAKAFCNGLLLDSTQTGDTITWHWKLYENIPSYPRCNFCGSIYYVL